MLMPRLSTGRAAKNEVKFCYACWLFRKCGSLSKPIFKTIEAGRACHRLRQLWLDNWEVKLWFGEIEYANFAADYRLPCPKCVLGQLDLLVIRKSTTTLVPREAVPAEWRMPPAVQNDHPLKGLTSLRSLKLDNLRADQRYDLIPVPRGYRGPPAHRQRNMPRRLQGERPRDLESV
jgi:hypothetical protein